MISLDRITVDPAKMNGQPCIRGMRLTVRRVLEIGAMYPDPAARRVEFPELEEEDYRQALHFAAMQLPDQVIALDSDALMYGCVVSYSQGLIRLRRLPFKSSGA